MNPVDISDDIRRLEAIELTHHGNPDPSKFKQEGKTMTNETPTSRTDEPKCNMCGGNRGYWVSGERGLKYPTWIDCSECLKRDLTSAQSRIAELESDFDEFRSQLTDYEYCKKRLELLRDQIASLQKDKERLDWLSQGFEWHIDMDYYDGTWAVGTMRGNANDREYKTLSEGYETVREAIDAAMQPKPETPAEPLPESVENRNAMEIDTMNQQNDPSSAAIIPFPKWWRIQQSTTARFDYIKQSDAGAIWNASIASQSAVIERLKAVNAEDLKRLTEAVELGSKQAEQYDKDIERLKGILAFNDECWKRCADMKEDVEEQNEKLRGALRPICEWLNTGGATTREIMALNETAMAVL